MSNNRFRGTFGSNGIASFGGLTFANNKFEFADPVYDDLHAASEQRANTWYQNKAGVEQTTDFINAQSVLDKDKGIKDGALTKFADHVKPFVDNGRYEEASFALTDAVRDFQNNKGFQLATGNYKVYADWSQKQRDKKGWSDEDKNIFIKANSDEYEGVQVHADGTVSGSFNGRDMGEYVDIQSKLAPMLKDWDADEVDQVLKEMHVGGWGETTIQDKKTIKSKNGKAIMAYAKNFIENDPEIKQYLATRQYINQNRNPADLANRVINSIANSKGDQFQFDAEYKALSETKPKSGDSPKLEFEKMYARRDNDGNIVLDDKGNMIVDPFLHAFRSQMISSGMLDKDELAMNASDLYKRFNGVMQEAGKRNTSRQELSNIYDKKRQGFELSNVEQVILRGEAYRQGLSNIDKQLFIAEQAYNAFLPHSGVQETISNLHTVTSRYYEWQAGQAAEQKARELALLNTTIGVQAAPMLQQLEDKGVDAFTDRLVKSEGNIKELASALNGYIGTFEQAINEYNADPTNTSKVKPLAQSVRMIGDGYSSVQNISDAQMAVLKKKAPAALKDYLDKLGQINTAKAQHTMDKGLMDQAKAWAQYKDKDNYPTEKRLQEEYNRLVTGKSGKGEGFDDLVIGLGGDAFKIPSYQEYKEGRLNEYTSNSEYVKKFIKDHIASGFTTDIVSLEGIRTSKNSDPMTNQAKSTINAIDKDILGKILSGGIGYRFVTTGGISSDNKGSKATSVDSGWFGYDGSVDIKNGKLDGVYLNPATGKEVYRFAVTDDTQDGNIDRPKGYVEIDDIGLQYKELLRSIVPGLMDAESANTFNAMQGVSSYSDRVNYSESLPNLFEKGAASIAFTANGISRPVGTLRLDFATYENKYADSPENSTVVNKSSNAFIYEYLEDGKVQSQVFDSYNDAINFINRSCDKYIAGYNKK